MSIKWSSVLIDCLFCPLRSLATLIRWAFPATPHSLIILHALAKSAVVALAATTYVEIIHW